MRIVTGNEMKEIDQWAQRKLGIAGEVLMENAGRGCADILENYFSLDNLRVMVLCGCGNNGGDGFVISRHLHNRGANVLIILLGKAGNLTGDALTNYRIARKAGLDIVSTVKKDKVQNLIGKFQPEATIDALFGTGFSGKPKGISSQVIELINDLNSFILSVDIPSGINSDNGQDRGLSVVADATATMCLPKLGNYLYPGRAYAGDLWLVDIGIPYLAIKKGPLTLLTHRDMHQQLPFRMPQANKGTFGYVLVVAGARGYSGAACMAAKAALRVGAGLVRLATPTGIADAVESQLVEVVKVPLPQTDSETISYKALDRVLMLSEDSDVVVVGPGVTTNSDTKKFIINLILNLKTPFILDADGLNCIADNPKLLRKVRTPKVLTPHPGEFSRIIKRSSHEIDQDWVKAAMQSAQDFDSVVVLKGAPTIIAEPNGHAYLNPTGNSGLATAGSGDVLVGMIGGFVAQGLTLAHASALAVHLHGLAADLGIKKLNAYSLTAQDLFTFIPKAINFLTEEKYEETNPALLYSS